MNKLSQAVLVALGMALVPYLALAADAAVDASSRTDAKKKAVELKGVDVHAGDREADDALRLSTEPSNDPASVSRVTARDIEGKVATSTADLLRGVAGVQVSDYGQPGEAKGITLRGWSNGYDGAYVAYSQDGYLRNLSSGISVNGYLDLNPLIPETINDFTVVRGPFDVRYGGNFAQAGAVIARTKDALPTGAKLEFGSYGYRRGVASYGHVGEDDSFYTIVDGSRQDGYRANADSRALKTFSKYTRGLGDGHFSAGLETYASEFGEPGYIALSKIRSGEISARSAVDASDGGKARSYALTSNYVRGDESGGLEANAYVGHSDLTRYATVTPYPQYYRNDDRWVFGAGVDSHWALDLFGADALLSADASARRTNGRMTKLPSVDGVEIAELNELDAYYYQRNHFQQTDLGSYLSLSVKPVDWLKLTAGIRYDRFLFDVTNLSYDATSVAFVRNAFTAQTGKLSQKLGVAIQPVESVTVFANYGQSPRSPSAVSDLPSNPNLSPATLESSEIGASFDSSGGAVHLQASGYRTNNTNEISIVGTEVVNLGRSKRDGWDVEGKFNLLRANSANADLVLNYSKVHARLADGSYVPYVAEWIGAYGLRSEWALAGGERSLRLDLNHEFVGPQQWSDDGSVSSDAYSRVQAKLTYADPARSGLKVWGGAVYYPGSLYSEFGFVLSDEIYVNTVPRLQLQAGVSFEF
ncbi:MAG: TonB-dependent receptor [Pseudomonas sp.]